MIVHGEQPWAKDHTGRYGWWREVESLWDGTRRWEYVDPPVNFFQLVLSRLPSASANREKVSWLEDTFMPTMYEQLGPGW